MIEEKEDPGGLTHLFEGLVVDEARSILWNLELALLDVLAELPKRVLATGLLSEAYRELTW